MNLPFRIAFRYFRSRNKRSFISIIAVIAMLGVGVGTMAMVIVLSVFNGMEELNRTIFKNFDAEITILPKEGRRFVVTDSLLEALNGVDGVRYVTQVIEDNALARYHDQSTIVRLKGVDSTYALRGQLDTAIIDGTFMLKGANGTPFAVVSNGVRQALLISLREAITPLELWYPRGQSKTLNLSSPDAFNEIMVRPSATFFVESRYDDYVIVPLEVTAELMNSGNARTSLEIQLDAPSLLTTVQKTLQKDFGNDYKILSQDEMNADLLRAIRIEKLFVTVTIALIILVAGINIFFSLSMLAIEKKKDIAILFAMGATRSLIRNIFIAEGVIVSFTGAVTGLLAGVVVCLLQEHYGLVSMGMESALVDAYPVKIIWKDVFVTAVIIMVITVLVSAIPAIRASETSYEAAS